MSVRNPGPPSLLPDNPFTSGLGLASPHEMGLHAATHGLYGNMCPEYDSDTIIAPRYVRVTSSSLAETRRWLLDLTQRPTKEIVCEFVARSEAAVDLLTARLKTYTFANPPVAISTGTTYSFSSRDAAWEIEPGNTLPRYTIRGAVVIAPNTSSTYRQVFVLEMSQSSGQRWPVYLDYLRLYEAPAMELT